MRPGEAACIIETDCNVDFEPPVGYVEPGHGVGWLVVDWIVCVGLCWIGWVCCVCWRCGAAL